MLTRSFQQYATDQVQKSTHFSIIGVSLGVIGSASHAFLGDSALGTPPSRRQAVIKDMHEAFRMHFVQKLQYNSVCRRDAGAPRALHLIRHIYRHDSHFRLHLVSLTNIWRHKLRFVTLGDAEYAEKYQNNLTA